MSTRTSRKKETSGLQTQERHIAKKLCLLLRFISFYTVHYDPSQLVLAVQKTRIPTLVDKHITQFKAALSNIIAVIYFCLHKHPDGDSKGRVSH